MRTPTETSPSRLPTVTVVLCLRDIGDAAVTLARRVRAVAALPGVDVVIVDDGSADHGADTLAGAVAGEDPIRVVRHGASAGVAARRNEALALARGEYIWFVDHDEEWTPAGLRALRTDASGADLVVARADFRWGPGDADRRPVDGVSELDGVGLTAPVAIDARRAAALLVEGAFHGFLWSKLF